MARRFPPGPVTVNDLWNIVPPNPPVSTVELTGQEMWDMIEENLERALSADPYQQMGGYVKRCLGLKLYVKLENPAGSRIQQLFRWQRRIEARWLLHGRLRDNPRRAEKIRTQPPRSGTARHRRPQALLRRTPVRERGSAGYGDRRLIHTIVKIMQEAAQADWIKQ